MPCDRDFGRIEKKRRRKDKFVRPSEWVKLIAATDRDRSFTIVHVEHPVIDNMLPDGNAVIKVKDYKAAYEPFLRAPSEISAIRGLLFKRGTNPLSRTSMNGDCLKPVSLLKRGKKINSVITMTQLSQIPDAYVDFLPIKAAKLKGVEDLWKHVALSPDVGFYRKLRSSEDNGESDEEDLE